MSGGPIKAIIVGAGPAGLTAAYELAKAGQRVLVLESDPEYVGGISRTVNYHGYRIDIEGCAISTSGLRHFGADPHAA